MSQAWSEYELILALELYVREPRCLRSNPALTKLANQMDRTVGSVYARLQNFKAVDPRYPGTGLSAGIAVCKPIWDAYWERLEKGESVDHIMRSNGNHSTVNWLDSVRSHIQSRWHVGQRFSISEVYELERPLAIQYPANKHIRDKIRQTLQKLRDLGELEFLFPDGNYELKVGPASNLFPDEIEEGASITEGARKRVEVNAFERNSQARTACILYHGCQCVVCSMSFAEMYGDWGAGFIHVHHLKPISSIGEQYIVDPIKDLTPVCPNCHAMLHRTSPPLTIDELRNKIRFQ